MFPSEPLYFCFSKTFFWCKFLQLFRFCNSKDIFAHIYTERRYTTKRKNKLLIFFLTYGNCSCSVFCKVISYKSRYFFLYYYVIQWAGSWAEENSSLYQKEIDRRNEFNQHLSGHFLLRMFTGYGETPPEFAVSLCNQTVKMTIFSLYWFKILLDNDMNYYISAFSLFYIKCFIKYEVIAGVTIFFSPCLFLYALLIQ